MKKFYMMPQDLLYNKEICEALHSDAKILYTILRDRRNYSIKNNLIDNKGRVYTIYTNVKVQEKLNISKNTVTKAFKELESINLIERGKYKGENVIYVNDISACRDVVDNLNDFSTGSKIEPSKGQNLSHEGSKIEPSKGQNLSHEGSKIEP